MVRIISVNLLSSTTLKQSRAGATIPVSTLNTVNVPVIHELGGLVQRTMPAWQHWILTPHQPAQVGPAVSGLGRVAGGHFRGKEGSFLVVGAQN